eukprot:gene10111-biopygen7283
MLRNDNKSDASMSVECHKAVIMRNKRLLLAYLMQRMERLKSACWESKPPNRADISSHKNASQLAYESNLTTYMSEGTGIGLELRYDTQGLDFTMPNNLFLT